MADTRIASFHLVRERPGRAVAALARLATDRPALRRAHGLLFWRLLGTGRGTDTGFGVDVRRTALFALWDDDAALDHFLAHSDIARRWDGAEEAYTVRLRSLGGHGTWRGVDVLDGMAAGVGEAGAGGGSRVAILTRAVVRARHWPQFLASGPAVSEELAGTAGLLAVAGVGEAPLGRQATFSLWRDLDAALRFAHVPPAHGDVVQRTRAERWYGEGCSPASSRTALGVRGTGAIPWTAEATSDRAGAAAGYHALRGRGSRSVAAARSFRGAGTTGNSMPKGSAPYRWWMRCASARRASPLRRRPARNGSRPWIQPSCTAARTRP